MGTRDSDSIEPADHTLQARRTTTWLFVGGIVVLATILRAAYLREGPGGFQVYNEIFYLEHAQREASRALLSIFYNPVDLNNPPLFTALAAMVVRLHGPIVAGTRMISVLSGIASVVITFLLGRMLFDERTGLISAAVLAVMPGMVLVNHNIQVDSLFVALLMGGVFFYVRSSRSGAMSDAAVGGVLLGLATLTKQPAILALFGLAAWRSWAQLGFSWLREKRTWVFVATSIVVGGSWYAVQLVMRPRLLISSMISVSQGPGMLSHDMYFWGYTLGSELMWALFPLAAAVAAAGVWVMAAKREPGDRFVLTFVVLYLGYYIGFHKHSYYLLPLLPFLALTIARACTGAFSEKDAAPAVRVARIAVVSVLLAAMTLGSVVTMTGQKWGRWSPMELQIRPDPGYQSVHLYYNSWLDGMYSSLKWAVNPQYSPTLATAEQFNAAPAEPGVEKLYLVPRLFGPNGQRLPAREDLTESRVRIVLFGFAIGQRWDFSTRTQVFTNEPWTAEKVGAPWQFGMQSMRVVKDYSLY